MLSLGQKKSKDFVPPSPSVASNNHHHLYYWFLRHLPFEQNKFFEYCVVNWQGLRATDFWSSLIVHFAVPRSTTGKIYWLDLLDWLREETNKAFFLVRFLVLWTNLLWTLSVFGPCGENTSPWSYGVICTRYNMNLWQNLKFRSFA